MFRNCFSNRFYQQPLYFEGNSTSIFHSALWSHILYKLISILKKKVIVIVPQSWSILSERMKTTGGEMGLLQIVSVADLVFTRIVL